MRLQQGMTLGTSRKQRSRTNRYSSRENWGSTLILVRYMRYHPMDDDRDLVEDVFDRENDL